MNEDFLPKIYQEMYLSKTVEDYQKDFLVPVIHSRDEIQWIIDYIRNTLKEIDFNCSNSRNKRELKRIKAYQEEKEEQLDVLRICEINIKNDTNSLLNAIAGSVNHKWDDSNLTSIIGFQSNKIQCSEKLIPLPLLSLSYVVLMKYCLLIKCAINAMILKYKVISLVDNNSSVNGNDYRKNIISFQRSIMQLERMFRLHDDQSRRESKRIEDKIDQRNRSEKRKTLTQEACADALYKQIIRYSKKKENHLVRIGMKGIRLSVPKEAKNVERTIQRWDQYLLSDGEKGIKPPKGYSREMSEVEFDRWAETYEQIKYEKWEKKQRTNVHKKRESWTTTNSLDEEEYIEEEEDKNLEKEEDQETRAKEDMVARFARTR